MPAHKGNQYAKGNRGGAAPFGNQNALKHGGYARITFDSLTPEEIEMVANMDFDGEQLIREEIGLCTLLEFWLMREIKRLNECELMAAKVVRSETRREFSDEVERERYLSILEEQIEKGVTLPGRVYRQDIHTEAASDVVLRMENLLTKVQARKLRYIQSLIELENLRAHDSIRYIEWNLPEAMGIDVERGIREMGEKGHDEAGTGSSSGTDAAVVGCPGAAGHNGGHGSSEIIKDGWDAAYPECRRSGR